MDEVRSEEYAADGFELVCSGGYRLTLTHVPERKRPVIALSLGGVHVGHAVFADEGGFEAFKEFFMDLARGAGVDVPQP